MREGYSNLPMVTVDGPDRIYEDGGILYEDGVITHVGDRAYIEEKAGELKIELKDGKGRYLFPGLINTHTHLYQDIMKGMGRPESGGLVSQVHGPGRRRAPGEACGSGREAGPGRGHPVRRDNGGGLYAAAACKGAGKTGAGYC